jgi:DnaK suppressor protein
MIGERLRQRLFLIEEALDAIENGEYGICAACEEPINEKLLLLMPFALLCVRCQSEIERQARMRGQLAA